MPVQIGPVGAAAGLMNTGHPVTGMTASHARLEVDVQLRES